MQATGGQHTLPLARLVSRSLIFISRASVVFNLPVASSCSFWSFRIASCTTHDASSVVVHSRGARIDRDPTSACFEAVAASANFVLLACTFALGPVSAWVRLQYATKRGAPATRPARPAASAPHEWPPGRVSVPLSTASQAAAASLRARPPWSRLQGKACTDASEWHETAGGFEQGATLGLGIGALRFQVLDLLFQGAPFLLKVAHLCSRRAHGTLGEAPLRSDSENETDLVT